QRVLANNKAWRAAEIVRGDWLKNFVARKSAPKDALQFIFTEVAEGDHQLRDGMENSMCLLRASRHRSCGISLGTIRARCIDHHTWRRRRCPGADDHSGTCSGRLRDNV